MSQRYLPDKLTTAEPRAAIEALARACIELTEQLPTAEGLACHVAQSALETGHWKACHWWNFGNVKASASYDGTITYFGCNEILKNPVTGQRQVHWFHPSAQRQWSGHDAWLAAHPASKPDDSQCRWRAYETIELGSTEQLAFLAKRNRYRAAWDAGLRGDPIAFSRALRAAGYYTADESHYTKLLNSLFGKYLMSCREVITALGNAPTTASNAPTTAGGTKASEVVARGMDVPENHDERKAEELCDAWLKALVLEIPWEEMREKRNQSVLAMNDTSS